MKMITSAIVALFAVAAIANDHAAAPTAATTTAPAAATATATTTKETKTTKTKETKAAAATPAATEKKDCTKLTGEAQKTCLAETTPAAHK
jgi:hypothetical protein